MVLLLLAARKNSPAVDRSGFIDKVVGAMISFCVVLVVYFKYGGVIFLKSMGPEV